MSVILPIEIPESCLDCPCHDGEYGVCNLTRKTIDDVRPDDCPIQEVKHGKWEKIHPDFDLCVEFFKCSICGGEKNYTTPYCPFCGAEMDEEEQE